MTQTTPTTNKKEDSETNSESESQGDMTNPPCRDHIEQLEWLMHIFFEAIRKPWHNTKRIATYLMVDGGGYRMLDESVQWIVRNPLSSFAIFIVFAMMLPFLLLIGIGIGIIALTFTGFIVLEGTLLTFVSMLSFGCLGVLFILLTVIAAVTLSFYMGFSYIYDTYGSGKITALTDYLKKEHDSMVQGRNQTRSSTLGQRDIDTIGSSTS